MYSLDINFLKDRQPQTKAPPSGEAAPPSLDKWRPAFLGAAAGALLLALTGISWLWVVWQTGQANQRLQVLEGELQAIEAKTKKIQEANQKVTAVNNEISGLLGAFNQVKPLSAILQDLQDQIPQGVQLSSIQQTVLEPQKKPAAKEGQEAAVPGIQLTLKGYARNYADVNDFLLLLQNSSFLKPDQTRVQSAVAAPLPVTIANSQDLADRNLVPEFPPAIEYTITTELSQVPASQLLSELARKGAVGAIARIDSGQAIARELEPLKPKGATQP